MRRRPENFNLFVNGLFCVKGKITVMQILFIHFNSVLRFAWKVSIIEVVIRAEDKIDILVHFLVSNFCNIVYVNRTQL